MKAPTICYLDATPGAKGSAAGAHWDWSNSSVIEPALTYCFSSAIDHVRDGLILNRHDDLNRRLARMERDQQAQAELCDLGLQYQCLYGRCAMNAAPVDSRPFIDACRKQSEVRVAPGRKLLVEALTDGVSDERDFVKTSVKRKQVRERSPLAEIACSERG